MYAPGVSERLPKIEALRACINGSRNADNGCAEVGAARQYAESAGSRGGIVAVVILIIDLELFCSVKLRSNLERKHAANNLAGAI